MKRMMTGIAISAALAAGACKVDQDGNVDGGLDAGDVDIGTDASEDGADAAPSADAEAELDAAGPLVEVLAPDEPAVGDFSSDAILTRKDLSVRCQVAPNADTGAPVDPNAVRVVVTGAGGQVIEASAQPALAAREYAAELNLGAFANGEIEIRCEADDTQSPPETGSAAISSYLDLGPRIQIVNPVASAAYANRLDVFVLIESAPVAADDDAAALDFGTVELIVSGEVLEDVQVDESEGTFEASVVFEDFDPELLGDNTLIVRASNSRQDEAVTREQSVVFNADGTGPVIQVSSPEPGELVSGIVTVTAAVTDEAGVDQSSVAATIAGEHEFQLFSVAPDTFVGRFDTRELGLGLVHPTVVIRARDAVGNESQFGFLVALDNRPPILSLNSPPIRETRRNEEGELECSLSFDPLGDDAAKDGQTVPQLSEIRVRIEDLGNGAVSSPGVVIRNAGVDHDKAQLFILDDADGALIVDTTGNGFCDSINPLLVPTSVPQTDLEAAVLNLVPVGPAGSSHFTAEGDDRPGDCTEIEEEIDAPEEVCFQSPATRQIATAFGEQPAVFSIAPVTDEQCWGFAFDAPAANISDGFACLAARAEDNLGNKGISPPLRLCFSADGSPCEGTALGDITEDELPDCTGTYDRDTDTVDTAASCTPPLTFDDDDSFQRRRIDLN